MSMTKQDWIKEARYWEQTAAEQRVKANYWEHKYNELKRNLNELAKNRGITSNTPSPTGIITYGKIASMRLNKEGWIKEARYWEQTAAEQREKARYWEQKYNELKRKLNELAKNTK